MGLLKNTNEYLQKFDKYIKKYIVNTDHDIGTTLMLRMLNDGVSDKYSSDEKPELKEYLPTGLTGDEFHTYVLDRVNDMHSIENALIALTEAGVSLLYIDYLNLKLSESTIDRNKFVELIKDDTLLHSVAEVTTSGDNTIVFEIKRYRTRKMFISKELYDSESWKSILNPHNFIARLNLYDYIFFLNATETDEEEWIIPNGITVDDKNYNSIKALMKDIDPVTNRILIIVANKKDVTNSIECSSFASLTEPTKLQILENTSTEDIINQWIVYTKERIKELNRFYQKLLHEIDSLNIVLYPDKIHYVDFYDYRNRKIQTPVKITTEHTYSIISYKLETIKHVQNIITLYNQFLLNCHVFGRALRDMKNPPSGNPIGVMGIRPYGTAYILSYDPIGHTQPAGYEYHSINDMIEDFELYNSIPGITDSYVLNKYPRCVIMTSGNKHGRYSDNKMEEQEIVNTNVSPDIYRFDNNEEKDITNLNEYTVKLSYIYYDIMAEDLFDEHIKIHPEKLDQNAILKVKSVEELVDYFNATIKSSYGDENYTAGMAVMQELLFEQNFDMFNRHYGIENFLPVNLTKDEFHQYLVNRITEMNQIEKGLVDLIHSDVLLMQACYDKIQYTEATTNDKKLIKSLKKHIEEHSDDIIKESGKDTIVYDFSRYHRGKVYINKILYKQMENTEILKPSRFLVRSGIYDYIIMVHGEDNNQEWIIEDGITKDGKRYTTVKELVKSLDPSNHRILLMICNKNDIKLKLDEDDFHTVEYGRHKVIAESTTQVEKYFSSSQFLNEWSTYIKDRIKLLDQYYQKILHQIDKVNITLYPKEVNVIEIYNPITHKINFPIKIVTKKISSVDDLKVAWNDSIRHIIRAYKQFLINCNSFGKILQKTERSLSENTYNKTNIHNTKEYITETVSVKETLYPVYIVLVHSGTLVSNMIKNVTHAMFSHVSIAFDSSLEKMYSFARKDPRNPFLGGFRYESINKGFYEGKSIPYALYVVPCTKKQVDKMKKRLEYFIKNENKFSFDFVGLFKNYLGIEDNPENKFFCSRFVADILNAGSTKKKPFIDKPSLMDPEEFRKTKFATYVSGGLLTDYNPKVTDLITKRILRKESLKKQRGPIKTYHAGTINESVMSPIPTMNPFQEMTENYRLAMMTEDAFDTWVEYNQQLKLHFNNKNELVFTEQDNDKVEAYAEKFIKDFNYGKSDSEKEVALLRLRYLKSLLEFVMSYPISARIITDTTYRNCDKLWNYIKGALKKYGTIYEIDHTDFNLEKAFENSKYSSVTLYNTELQTVNGKTIVCDTLPTLTEMSDFQEELRGCREADPHKIKKEVKTTIQEESVVDSSDVDYLDGPTVETDRFNGDQVRFFNQEQNFENV